MYYIRRSLDEDNCRKSTVVDTASIPESQEDPQQDHQEDPQEDPQEDHQEDPQHWCHVMWKFCNCMPELDAGRGCRSF